MKKALLPVMLTIIVMTGCEMESNSTAFVTRWDMSLGEGTTLTFPLQSGNYDYTIDWGDGTVEEKTDADAQHVYDAAGLYTVTITGTCEGFGFVSPMDDNHENFVDVLQWGNVVLHNYGQQFAFCDNLAGFSAQDIPDLSGVTYMLGMFHGSESFNGDISRWDVSGVENMTAMFMSASSFDQDISGWVVSSVTNMTAMFYGADAFNQDIGGWDTSHVTDMNAMFYLAEDFDQDLSLWNVAAVTDMAHMFQFAASYHNGGNPAGLEQWTVQSGCDTFLMFSSCPLTPQPSWY